MKKREFTAEYKAKIVIEILQGEKTVSEIASRENISAKQLYNWKKEFLENSHRAFSQSKDEKEAKNQVKEALEKEDSLMSKVGSLTIENDWLKKNTKKSTGSSGIHLLVSKNEQLSIKRQCELLGLNRTSFYYEPKRPSDEDVALEELIKFRIDYWHAKQCYLGVRKLVAKLKTKDSIYIGRKLVRRFMDEMGIYAVFPKPNLSKRNMEHKIYPYLLRNIAITKPNQVWAIDITYIKMGKGHMYLTAIIDWSSRFIVGYELSDTLDTAPVLDAIKRAIAAYGKPEIINSDQGCQFTSEDYTRYLETEKIRQSMDGKARWVDNVIIERWFRSLKCEYLYITEHENPRELRQGIGEYVREYNTERPHQSLDNQYPKDVYLKCVA